MNTVFESNREEIVENLVEVPVEKVVEVEVNVTVEKPVFREIDNVETIDVDITNETVTHITVPEELIEREDEELAREITRQKRDIEVQQS